MIKVPGLVISCLAGLTVRNRDRHAFKLFDHDKESTQTFIPLQGLTCIGPSHSSIPIGPLIIK